MTRTLALVESATQLLNVGEWAYAGGGADDLSVAVLAPRDAHTVQQLRSVAALVRTLGVPVDVLPVRTPGAEAALGTAGVARRIRQAKRLLVGDPFSRFIQTLLPLSRAEQVVVVDDGTATWEYARCVDAGKPMVRWDRPLADREPRAERATAFFSPGPSREICVFSCLDDAAPLGAVPLANRYSWTRARRRPEVVDDVVDVLGTSLVATGTVDRRSYLGAVAAIARQAGAVRYIAHRREADDLAAEIGRLPGVRLVRAALPVELELRETTVAEQIVTFPSTAAHTLPVVLGDLRPAVQLDVRRIRPEWFTATTTRHAREFVARIAALAPATPPRAASLLS